MKGDYGMPQPKTDYTPIGKMSLKNQGGFTCQIQFSYRVGKSGEKHLAGHTGDITLGFTKTADPGDHDVPDRANVSMVAIVHWGRDNEAQRLFTYV
jgi:hypothetical protein